MPQINKWPTSLEVLYGQMAAFKFLLFVLVPEQARPILRLSNYCNGCFLIPRGIQQTQREVLLIISLRRGPGDPKLLSEEGFKI